MSQEKVDRYKEAKANREKTMKKEKLVRRVEYTLTALVLAGLVAWCGYSVYQKAASAKAEETHVYEVKTDAIDDYVTGLSADADTSESSETAETSEAE